jgi:hypothetical protein
LKLIRDHDIVWGVTLLDFISSFHLPKKSRFLALAGAVAAALTLVWAPSCRRSTGEIAGETEAADADRALPVLALVPPDARIVVSLDLERLRGQPGWTMLLSALAKDPRHWLGDFTGGTGLDLTQHLRRVLVALPGERQADNRFAVIADIDRLDEARVTTWLRKQLGPATVALVRDHRQLVIGHGAWGQGMAGLASAAQLSPSAADSPELRRLCQRAADGHAFWFAAVVPASVRHDLVLQDRFPDAASIMRMSGFADLDAGLHGDGLHAEMTAELSNTRDAAHLARRLTVFLNQARRHPRMLVLGLAPYLEALRLEARDASVKASVELPVAQLGEVIERIEALARGAWTK